MFKRLVNVVKNIVVRSEGPSSSPTFTNTPFFLKEMKDSNPKIQAAHIELQEAVKELSKGQSIPVSVPPIASINDWISKPKEDLNVTQLEELARVYFDGNAGFDKNPTKAVELWDYATSKGSLESQYSRALCYKDGIGVSQDIQKAHQDLLELTEKNYSLAHYSLAVMLDKGDQIAQDYESAFKHFKLAAKGGVQPALHNIGNAYATGKGVKQSDRNALLYYEGAAEAGDPSALFTLGTWYYFGKGGLIPDKEKAFKLQLKAAESGHPLAMYNVGTAYLTSDGTYLDEKEAAIWLERSCKFNIPGGILNFSKMILENKVPGKDLNDAKQNLLKISDRNDIAKELLIEIENRLANGNK